MFDWLGDIISGIGDVINIGHGGDLSFESDRKYFIANQLFNATATMLVCISQICCFSCANF